VTANLQNDDGTGFVGKDGQCDWPATRVGLGLGTGGIGEADASEEGISVVASANGLEDRQVGARLADLIIEQKGRFGNEHAARGEDDVADVVAEGLVGVKPFQVRGYSTYDSVGRYCLVTPCVATSVIKKRDVENACFH
jgi:hypothetical protein